jgi:DNA repair photolyase
VPALLKINHEEWSEVKARVNIPQVLRQELKSKKPGVVGLSTVTDPYQPAEKYYGLTKKCIPLLAKRGFGINIQTKSDLVVQDKDILHRIENLAVGITITTLNETLCRKLEIGAPPPNRRLDAIRALVDAEIYTYVFYGPVLPTTNSREVYRLVDAVAAAGITEIIYDKLHVKPGLMEWINAALSSNEAIILKKRLNDPNYYDNIFSALINACDSRIQPQQAFVPK